MSTRDTKQDDRREDGLELELEAVRDLEPDAETTDAVRGGGCEGARTALGQ